MNEVNKMQNGLPEARVDRTLDPVRSQTKVHVSFSPEPHIILVESVVQTLIQVLQVQQYHGFSGLHAHFDLVDVATHLNRNETVVFIAGYADKLMLDR